MPRTPGSKNNPLNVKRGPKPGLRRFAYDLEEAGATELKTKMLELLTSGDCRTLTDAAVKLGLNPTKVYYWRSRDEVWREQLAMVDEVLADRLEAELMELPSGETRDYLASFVRARIFLLTGARPWKYRDSSRLNAQNSRIETLINELKKLGATKPKIEPVPSLPPPSTSVTLEGTFRELVPTTIQ